MVIEKALPVVSCMMTSLDISAKDTELPPTSTAPLTDRRSLS